MDKEQNFINIYHNSLEIDSLYKILLHDLKADFLLITWHIVENTWYIPILHHNDLLYKEKYVVLEPTNNNINKLNILQNEYHGVLNLITFSTIHSNVVYNGDTKLSDYYLFILESFLSKLIHHDIIMRHKYKQETLLSNICHSVRTPLNGILHMTNNLIEQNETPNSTWQESLEYLNQSVAALANNIFDIIDVTQLEVGKLKIIKDIFNVRDLVHEVLAIANSLASNLIKNKKIILDYHIDDSVPEFIYSDAKRIKQILINLLENSIQHTSSGQIILLVQSVLIDLGHEEQINVLHDTLQHNISFMVHDTGVGIDPNTKQTLFRPTEINPKSSGLSLRISYLLAKKLDGELKLIYSEPNKGSCFQLDIVVYEEQPPIFDSDTLKSLKGKRILILDDSNEKLTVCRILDRYMMQYNLANTYEEILILHYSKKYDIIIINLNTRSSTPIIDIAYKIHDNWKGIPLLAITDNLGDLPKTIFCDAIITPINSQIFKQKLISTVNQKPAIINEFSDMKILIVEDEQINRIVMEKLLRSIGYKNIDLANNGEEAIKLISQYNYDLLLLDIRMPLMNGFELAESVYKSKKNIKMIGITAQLISEEEFNKSKDYLNIFVYKPIDIKELDKKIKEMFR